MTRTARTLFGSFGERESTPVFADGWWFFRASNVDFEGTEHVSRDLGTFLAACAAAMRRPLPERVGLDWFRDVAGVGLGLHPSIIEHSPILLGFVAARVQRDEPADDQIDVAYPFRFSSREDNLLLQFSSSGPPDEVQRQIGVAFCTQLLWRPA